MSRRRQSPTVSGPPRLSVAAILGPPLPRLVPSIFSLEFELLTMGIRFHSLFMGISVPGGNLHTTEHPLALQNVA